MKPKLKDIIVDTAVLVFCVIVLTAFTGMSFRSIVISALASGTAYVVLRLL